MTIEITTVAELLASLRMAPERRRVISTADGTLFVMDGHERIARIPLGSEADILLDEACTADIERDLTAWSSLPVRYGPGCSTWVLPEYPSAPNVPGGE